MSYNLYDLLEKPIKNREQEELEDANGKIAELSNKLSAMEQYLRKERADHVHETKEAEKKISELEKELETEKERAKKEILSLSKKVSDLEKTSKEEKKEKEERKALELKCTKLSKQNSDFEKVLYLEKERIEKERAEFESRRKVFESKNGELSMKISELEKELDVEKKELEKKKKIDFQARSLKDDSVYEKKILQQEILMLKKNLKTLSTDIKIEKRTKSDIQKKLELVTKERHVFSLKVKALKKSHSHSEVDRLSKERNRLTNKVKELEDILFKVEVSKQVCSNTTVQTPLADSTGSECSFKTAASSFNPDVAFKGFDRSRGYTKNQIRPSNLFYDPSVDKSSRYHSNDLPTFKKVKMEWKVKGKTPEKDATKSSVPKGKTFVKTDYVYSANHLIRLAQKNICCSFCGTHDFVKSERDQFWYGSYYISPNRPPLNTSGPKFRWVPKST